MDIMTGFIIYLTVFRLAIITAGVVSIVAGYMLFKHGLARGGKTEIEGQAGGYRLTVRNAAPGTYFALFGIVLIAVNFFDGGPGLTMKTLEKVSAIPIQEPQKRIVPELPKKSRGEVASSEQAEKGKTLESVNVKTKIPTPTHNTRQIENVTELTMKSAEADVIRESVERAKAFERKNRKADAIRTYEKALFLLGEPMNNLASLYLDVGKNDQAVLLAHLAVTISPDQAGFQHTYALSLSAVGNWRDALQVMEKAARLDPRYENDLNSLRGKYEQP